MSMFNGSDSSLLPKLLAQHLIETRKRFENGSLKVQQQQDEKPCLIRFKWAALMEEKVYFGSVDAAIPLTPQEAQNIIVARVAILAEEHSFPFSTHNLTIYIQTKPTINQKQ